MTTTDEDNAVAKINRLAREFGINDVPPEKMLEGNFDPILVVFQMVLEQEMVALGLLKDRPYREPYVPTGRPRGRPRFDCPDPFLDPLPLDRR